jgi:riboflavin kinase / FMN adenylyltransferase
MKLLRGEKPFIECRAGCVVTIGNFDGVHCGHQAMLALLREKASQMQLPMVVLVFEPQPSEYFTKPRAFVSSSELTGDCDRISKKEPTRLYQLREKLNVLHQCGADYVYCLKFNKQLASMSPEEFAQRFIFASINAKYILLGDDFRFGRNRQGDLSTLRELARISGVVVETCSDFCIEDRRVSSTQIRQALSSGQLETAATLLGRTYSVSGRVIYGQGLGRTIGVPTANISVHRRRLPLSGVFCVTVKRKTQYLNGIANLGIRPTINGDKQVLEVHLFDFNKSLYGERLEVLFVRKLRDEIKFSSFGALTTQIQMDIIAAREFI